MNIMSRFFKRYRRHNPKTIKESRKRKPHASSIPYEPAPQQPFLPAHTIQSRKQQPTRKVIAIAFIITAAIAVAAVIIAKHTATP